MSHVYLIILGCVETKTYAHLSLIKLLVLAESGCSFKEVRNGEEWLGISYLVIAEFLSTYKTRIEGKVTGSIPNEKENTQWRVSFCFVSRVIFL